MKLDKIIKKLEQFYPPFLQEEWDNIGLQIGSKNKEVKKILTALEITKEVIDEAIDYDIDLIVVHHPLIFKEVKNLNEDSVENQKIIRLIKAGIAVYVMHTNIDIAYNGINDWLCEIIEVNNLSYLKKTKELNMYALDISVDMDDMNTILDALPKFGFGRQIKDKEEQYLMFPKVKSYKDSRDGKIKTKDITIIQTTGTKEQIDIFKKYLYKLKTEHKIYTKLAYYLIEDYTVDFGIGRVGYIKPKSLEMFSESIKAKFNMDHVKIVGSREKIIKKIAVVGGSGANYIKDAKKKKCDVLITGDIGFHDAQLALDLDICLIDGGHYLEIIFNDGMEEFLSLIDSIDVMASKINTNPFEVI